MSNTEDTTIEKQTGQHAPGPWVFESVPPEAHTDPDLELPEEYVFWIAEARIAGHVLAVVERTPRDEAQAEANARLIAAAPDLLAALKVAERFCPCGARPESLRTHPHVTGCQIAAAIANAEGLATS